MLGTAGLVALPIGLFVVDPKVKALFLLALSTVAGCPKLKPLVTAERLLFKLAGWAAGLANTFVVLGASDLLVAEKPLALPKPKTGADALGASGAG